MKKSQLELALRMAGAIARDLDFTVFGSQSILGTVEVPPKECLLSAEVDLYPQHHPQTVGLVATQLGARSIFFKKHGFFVDCVTPDVAAFPEGWTDRLIPFCNRRTGGVTGWCVELHDLSASKLAVAREKDLIYVRALLAARLIKPVILEKRIATLPANPSQRKEIFALVKQLVREANTMHRVKRKKK